MTGGYPLRGSVCSGVNYGMSGGQGTSVTPNATANQKGTYVQLTAASTIDACLVEVVLTNNNGSGTTSFDIGIGTGGAETVVLGDLMFTQVLTNCLQNYLFPLHIPKGTRIAARAQSNAAASNNYGVAVNLYDGSYEASEGAGGVDTIGFNSATTMGTTLVTAAFTQITAATAKDYCGMVATFCSTVLSLGSVDIAVGGAGVEQIIIPAQASFTGATGSRGGSVFAFKPVQIAAGSRLSAKFNLFSTGPCGVVLHGVYQ